MAYQLLVGFDEATPQETAATDAIQEWREALARDGWRATSEPVTRIVRTEARTAMGEYAVEVTGQRTRDDGSDGDGDGGAAVDGDV